MNYCPKCTQPIPPGVPAHRCVVDELQYTEPLRQEVKALRAVLRRAVEVMTQKIAPETLHQWNDDKAAILRDAEALLGKEEG